MNSKELLVGLLKHYSPTESETSAVNYLTNWMNDAGFETQIDHSGNAIGKIGTGPISIMLLGHIDTVQGEIPVRQEGDLIYGRGAVDAKGPLAAFASAASLGAIPGATITVIGAVGEEGDSRGASYLLNNCDRPDFLLIGEPSRWNRITLGYKGSISYTLSVDIPITHPASNTDNACEMLISSWKSLLQFTRAYNTQYERVFDQVTPTIRSINSTSDGIRDHAQMHITFRLPEGLTINEIKDKLQTYVTAPAKLNLTPGAVEAYRASKNTKLVRAALAAIRSKDGTPSFVVKTGTSDMNIVAPKWQCPSIAYGPGDSNLDHTPNEHISQLEYQRSIAVLRTLMENISNER
ncbi:MAG: acetyl-lysine deacetylase [Anaerolineaceae bacterium]|nr:acetyl-lysine deacetylase [Anaerolineaceae bacterium]